MKIGERIEALQRTYPHIGPARFIYSKRTDLSKRGKKVMVHVLMRSSDGRVSVHRTMFEKGAPMRVQEWVDWLTLNSVAVFQNQVIASVERTHGGVWHVERVIGWHFYEGRQAKKRGR